MTRKFRSPAGLAVRGVAVARHRRLLGITRWSVPMLAQRGSGG
jgi:hypothetical protein